VAALRTSLGLTDDDLAVLARNSWRAAFVDEAERTRRLAEIDRA
jgi:adenosine deaminase